MCVRLSLRGAGLAGGCVVPLRVDGWWGWHRRAWDGSREGGGQLGAHIQGVSQHPALPQLAPLDPGDSPSLKQLSQQL